MTFLLECQKAKRIGFYPALIGSSILAAAIPILNIIIRGEIDVTVSKSPLQGLLGANWQLMTMLNILFIAASASLLYHTEYADNAMQKLYTLPIHEGSVFFGKTLFISVMSLLTLTVEFSALAFCSYYWYTPESSFIIELCQNFGYSLLLLLPCMVLALLISEFCQSMWMSLGICVVCVFIATMLPTDQFLLSLFPFALPFQMLDTAQTVPYLCAACTELLILIVTEKIAVKIRRSIS